MTFAQFIYYNSPALIIAIPLLAAFLTLVFGRISSTLRNVWVVLSLIATAIVGLIIAYRVSIEGIIIYTFGAATPGAAIPIDSGGIPVRIIFEIDAMSSFMIITLSIATLAAIIYSIASDAKSTGRDNFYALFLLLTLGGYGIICTGDMFNFFVFFEISSLASAGLIAYRIEKGFAVEAALKYAVISTVAGIMVLIGVAVLYGEYDALNIAMLAQSIHWTFLDKFALVLLLSALLMKCGAVPMHFWTPDSYSLAPGSITAILVVASQVSLYGAFRVIFTLYGVVINALTFGWIIIILGVLSMVVGVTMAIPQKDVKRLMAYHAISQTGYMLLGVGVGFALLGDKALLDSIGYMAMEGGIFHIINHAMYKGLLFLTAGAIFYRIGTRNLNKMGGLGHNMKYTMIFFVIGALAIAGIPPFNGFASKLMIYESVFLFNPFLSVIAMVVSILTLASFVKVFHSIFMGPKLPEYANVKEAPPMMLIGMGLLAAGVILFGLFPQQVVDLIVSPAAHALVNQQAYISAVMGGA